MGLLSAPAALICIQPRARPTHEISSTNRVKESVISPVEPCPLDSHKNRSRERKGKGREKKEQRTTPSSPIEKVFIAVGRKKGRALNLELHYRNIVPIIRSSNLVSLLFNYSPHFENFRTIRENIPTHPSNKFFKLLIKEFSKSPNTR